MAWAPSKLAKDLTAKLTVLDFIEGMEPMVTRVQWAVTFCVLRRFFASLVKLVSTPKPPLRFSNHPPMENCSWMLAAMEYIVSLEVVVVVLRTCTMPMKQEP